VHILTKNPGRAGLTLAALLTLGCGDSTAPSAAPPPTAAVVVTVTTTSTGGEIDPDGYSLVLDSEPMRAVGVDDEVTFAAVPAGLHYLYLIGVAANCSIHGGNAIAVDVPGDRRTSQVPIFIVVICSALPPTGPSPWDY
jgi:hypothetical protein